MKKQVKLAGKVEGYCSGYAEDNYATVDDVDIVYFLEDFYGKTVEITVNEVSNSKYFWSKDLRAEPVRIDYVSRDTASVEGFIFQDDQKEYAQWGYHVPKYAEMRGFKTKKEVKLIVQKLIKMRDKKIKNET
jgi:hypothetical protein